MFIEILFKMLLFKGGVLIYAEHCIYCFIQVVGSAPWVILFIYLIFFTQVLGSFSVTKLLGHF